jgi:hypothetical protein
MSRQGRLLATGAVEAPQSSGPAKRSAGLPSRVYREWECYDVIESVIVASVSLV